MQEMRGYVPQISTTRPVLCTGVCVRLTSRVVPHCRVGTPKQAGGNFHLLK